MVDVSEYFYLNPHVAECTCFRDIFPELMILSLPHKHRNGARETTCCHIVIFFHKKESSASDDIRLLYDVLRSCGIVREDGYVYKCRKSSSNTHSSRMALFRFSFLLSLTVISFFFHSNGALIQDANVSQSISII